MATTAEPNDLDGHAGRQPSSRPREAEQEEPGRCKRHKTSARNAFSVLLEAAQAPLVFAPEASTKDGDEDEEDGDENEGDFSKESDEIPTVEADVEFKKHGWIVGASLEYRASSGWGGLVSLDRRLVKTVDRYSELVRKNLEWQGGKDKRARAVKEWGDSPLKQNNNKYWWRPRDELKSICRKSSPAIVDGPDTQMTENESNTQLEKLMACGKSLREDTRVWISGFLKAQGARQNFYCRPSSSLDEDFILQSKGIFSGITSANVAWRAFFSLLEVTEADMQAWWTGVNIGSSFSERAFILHLRAKLLPLVHQLVVNRLEQLERRTTERFWREKRVLEPDLNELIDNLLALSEAELRENFAFTQSALQVVAVLNADHDEKIATPLTPDTVRKRKVLDVCSLPPKEEQEEKGWLMDPVIVAKGRQLSRVLAAVVRGRTFNAGGSVQCEESGPERVLMPKDLDVTRRQTTSWSANAGVHLDASSYTFTPHTIIEVVLHYCEYRDWQERRQYLHHHGHSGTCRGWITGLTFHFQSGETRVDGYSGRRGESGRNGPSKELKLREGEILIAVKGTSEYLGERHTQNRLTCTLPRRSGWISRGEERPMWHERRRLVTISFKIYNQRTKTQRVWSSDKVNFNTSTCGYVWNATTTTWEEESLGEGPTTQVFECEPHECLTGLGKRHPTPQP